MAGQTSLTKADVEFANLSDYAVSVHLLGASFRQDGALSHPRFCQERRHFSIFEEFPPPLLPVDSEGNMSGDEFVDGRHRFALLNETFFLLIPRRYKE